MGVFVTVFLEMALCFRFRKLIVMRFVQVASRLTLQVVVLFRKSLARFEIIVGAFKFFSFAILC